MATWIHYLLVFAVAFGVTVALVPAVRRVAVRFGVVDQPGPRRVNRKPIPRMGGVAMFGGLLAAFVFEYVTEALGLWHGPLHESGVFRVQAFGILVGFCVIVLVGVLDDVFSLRPLVKFLGQVAAACVIAFSGVVLARFHLPFSPIVVSLGVWTYPITILYLVCFVNIINLIDGLDGLAAGITAISSVMLIVMMYSLANAYAFFFALVLVAMCVAFLIFNFNPASIFMGDSGSMLLGLVLGTVSLLGMVRFASMTTMLVPIVIALVPIVDTFAAIVRRLREHKPIREADAGHIHHRLLRRGWSQRKAVLVIYLWTALLSVGALLIWEVGGVTKYAVFTVLLVASAIITWRMGLFGPIRQRHGSKRYVFNSDGVDPHGDDDEG